MNKKMMEIRYTILNVIFNSFEDEYLDYIAFSGGVNINDFVDYIILEYIKYAYINKQEKFPLRHFVPYTAEGDNSIRMQYQRTRNYVQKYRDREYEIELLCGADEEQLKDLKPKSMKDIAQRLDGYAMTKMEFFEHTTIQELQIIKAIVEERLINSKKISNSKFLGMLSEYDAWVERLRINDKKSDEEVVFDSIAYFTLEWKYAIELLYIIAVRMDEENITDIDDEVLRMLCGRMDIDSELGIHVHIDSRLIKERENLVDFFVTKNPKLLFCVEDNHASYAEILTITCLLLEKITVDGKKLLKDYFAEETTIEDWASFLKEYNVFESWHEKKMTPKQIQNMRKLCDKVYLKTKS